MSLVHLDQPIYLGVYFFAQEEESMFGRRVLSLGMFVIFLTGGVGSVSAAPASGSKNVGPVEVSSAVYADVSAPVRDLVGMAPSGDTSKEQKDKPRRSLPNMGNALNQSDGALQNGTGPLVGTASGLNFAGVGQGDHGFSDQYAPPDTNGAVGATQYV